LTKLSPDHSGSCTFFEVLFFLEFSKQFVFRMQFVRGDTLNNVDPQLLPSRLTDESFKDIGRIFVLDVLINNFDRIPGGMWKNDGNIGNLMLTKSGRIYGIDQGVVSTGNDEATAKYLSTVEQNFDDFFRKKDMSIIVSEILNFINLNTGGCLSESENAKSKISSGILDAVNRLADIQEDEYHDIKGKIQSSVRVDWEDVWSAMCHSISPDFVQKISNVIIALAKIHDGILVQGEVPSD
jgi:hypothetical protein